MMCCGNEVATPFCSRCGKEMGRGGLLHLLKHLKANVKAQKSWQEICRRGGRNDRANKHQNQVDKWQGWVDAVEAAIAALDAAKETPY